MNKVEKKRIRQRKEAEKTVQVLKNEIEHIRYVGDWAVLVKCSKTKLNQLIKCRFGVTAKTMLKNSRLEAIKETIAEYPDLGGYAIACECGLNNERELYKFLSRNFETSFTDLKFKILFEEGVSTKSRRSKWIENVRNGYKLFKMDRENGCLNHIAGLSKGVIVFQLLN